MAKDRSDKSRYPSRYGGGWVSAAQYMTECLCVLIAMSEKKQQLDDKFWNKEPWTSVFRIQVPLATKLIKDYSPEVILSALRDRRCWKIRSFGANWLLLPILKEKQREHDAILKHRVQRKVTEKTPVNKKPIRKTGKKSLLNLLKESENGKKEKQ